MDSPRMRGAVSFDTNDAFWEDWWHNWFLYGTVYAINNPEPRVIPADQLTVHEGSCEEYLRLQSTDPSPEGKGEPR